MSSPSGRGDAAAAAAALLIVSLQETDGDAGDRSGKRHKQEVLFIDLVFFLQSVELFIFIYTGFVFY